MQPFSAAEHVTQTPHVLQGRILLEDFARDVVGKHYEMISSQKPPTRKSLCAPLPPAHDAGEHATQSPHDAPAQQGNIRTIVYSIA